MVMYLPGSCHCIAQTYVGKVYQSSRLNSGPFGNDSEQIGMDANIDRCRLSIPVGIQAKGGLYEPDTPPREVTKGENLDYRLNGFPWPRVAINKMLPRLPINQSCMASSDLE